MINKHQTRVFVTFKKKLLAKKIVIWMETLQQTNSDVITVDSQKSMLGNSI